MWSNIPQQFIFVFCGPNGLPQSPVEPFTYFIKSENIIKIRLLPLRIDEFVSVLNCCCYSGVGEDAMVCAQIASSPLCLTVPINIKIPFVGPVCMLG